MVGGKKGGERERGLGLERVTKKNALSPSDKLKRCKLINLFVPDEGQGSLGSQREEVQVSQRRMEAIVDRWVLCVGVWRWIGQGREGAERGRLDTSQKLF
jgi:hypothetical protein